MKIDWASFHIYGDVYNREIGKYLLSKPKSFSVESVLDRMLASGEISVNEVLLEDYGELSIVDRLI